MRRETAGRELLTWGLGVGAGAAPGNLTRPGTTPLEHFVSVHDVESIAPGAYRLRSDRLQPGREGRQRDLAAHLCFDQPLGDDVHTRDVS
jgi:hypothetical protein